jgi:alkylhydroperoxidase family enzyme
MSRPGVATSRPVALRQAVERLVEAITDGPSTTSVAARRAAFDVRADDPVLAHYVNVVRTRAYLITDDDIEILRGAGLDEDAIFEITVAAALGAGAERLRAGLSLLGGEP